MQVLEIALEVLFVIRPDQTIDARRGIFPKFEERLVEQIDADVVEERGEPSVPATFKIPRDVLAQLRAYSASSGLSLSAIVTRALKRCLTSTRQRRRHG